MGSGKQKLTSPKSIQFNLLHLPLITYTTGIYTPPEHAKLSTICSPPLCSAFVSANLPHSPYAPDKLGFACFLNCAPPSSTSMPLLKLLPEMPSSSISMGPNPIQPHGLFQAAHSLKSLPWNPQLHHLLSPWSPWHLVCDAVSALVSLLLMLRTLVNLFDPVCYSVSTLRMGLTFCTPDSVWHMVGLQELLFLNWTVLNVGRISAIGT